MALRGFDWPQPRLKRMSGIKEHHSACGNGLIWRSVLTGIPVRRALLTPSQPPAARGRDERPGKEAWGVESKLVPRWLAASCELLDAAIMSMYKYTRAYAWVLNGFDGKLPDGRAFCAAHDSYPRNDVGNALGKARYASPDRAARTLLVYSIPRSSGYLASCLRGSLYTLRRQSDVSYTSSEAS